MKKTLVVAIIVGLVLSLFAETSIRTKRTRPRGTARPSGGIVEKPYSGKVFRVYDIQKVVSNSKIAEMTRFMRMSAQLPFEVVSLENNLSQTNVLKLVDGLKKESNVGACVLIVEDEVLPGTLISPDSQWGILNISKLKSDSPSQAKLEERLTKVLWCTVARVLGAGYSSYPGCVLVPYSTMNELDSIQATRPCPEPFNKMIKTGSKYGITTITISTYLTACRQGWAPAPKTEVQKKIWEEIKAEKERGPTKPIKIVPPNVK